MVCDEGVVIQGGDIVGLCTETGMNSYCTTQEHEGCVEWGGDQIYTRDVGG